jgi:hypothetical protein
MEGLIETGLETEPAPTSPHPEFTLELDSTSPSTGLIAIPAPAPSLTPVLVKPYPKFITPAVLAHLSGLTNVEGWSDLVQAYLKFETASPSRNVSGPSISLLTLLS